MPSFASGEDKSAAKAVVRWEIASQEWLDDIREWRDKDPGKRIWEGGWPEWDNRFLSDTHTIVAWVAKHLSGWDGQPVLDFYALVKEWSGDLLDSSGLPSQARLDAMYDAARMVLSESLVRITERTVRPDEKRTTSKISQPGPGELVPPVKAPPDGPQYLATKLTRLSFGLIDYLWFREHASFEDLQENVWLKDNVSDETIKKAVKRTNDKLLEVGEPITLAVKNNHVTLEPLGTDSPDK